MATASPWPDSPPTCKTSIPPNACCYSPVAPGEGLMQDLLTVGLSAQQRLVDATDPLPLAALAGP